MNLLEVCVDTYVLKGKLYHQGEILFDCGLKIKGIHFKPQKDTVYINYPAVKDKKGFFHPSFRITDDYTDRIVKSILEYAWNTVKNEGEKTIYGRRKVCCSKEINELSEEDFEWFNEKREYGYSFSDIKESKVRVQLSDSGKGTGVFNSAYAQVCVDDIFVISNLKVLVDSSGNDRIQFPRHLQEEAVGFWTEEDREWMESYIIGEFSARQSLIDQIHDMENLTDEERLFRILWEASENGYILQSKIRGILEQNGIDWKNIHHVNRISELVEKMNFMSSRRLEISPEHFVDWVAVSYEKDPEPVIVENKNSQILSDDVKAELKNILSEEYKQHGKIDLANVIPFLSGEHPEILEKLPNVKLKRILQSCEFVRFEGGPMPPIYMHILDTDAWQSEEDCIAASEKNEETKSDPEYEKQDEYEEEVRTPVQKIKIYDHLATSNPFAFVPNTELLQEQNIPGSKLPKITVNDSMRIFLNLYTHGHIDSMDLEIVYWVSKLRYSKSTFLYDLIVSGFIEVPSGKRIDKDKLSTRLMRLYKVNLIAFYRPCSVDEEGNIVGKAAHRIMMITAYGRTQLRTIGRQSDFDFFMALDNIEKILNKLSVNQWFTKFIMLFKDAAYYLDVIVTAKIAEANAARIPLVIAKDGIPVFVSAFRRGSIFVQDIRSGEFAFWIKRVSNLIQNYNELYIGDHKVSFLQKPKLIFICEDSEHCREVYEQILQETLKVGEKRILENIWFAEDVNVYNDFLHAHYSFESVDKCVPQRIDEFLGVEINAEVKESVDFENEQDVEEEKDMLILQELEREENLMMLSSEE